MGSILTAGIAATSGSALTGILDPELVNAIVLVVSAGALIVERARALINGFRC